MSGKMDRRSWLWRRKSSDKFSGETESSGSMSSHSARFSDDQTYSIHSSQSPEVTSNAPPHHEESSDSVKTLTEKLSAALLNISAKEELVKQHAKVAEEAVSGWEKAENEVLSLKKQVESLTFRNSALEDRVGHLDGALKECLRQLRQAREEKEEKIHEAIEKKTSEWKSIQYELEKELSELRSQLHAARAEVQISTESNFNAKLETAGKEKSVLNRELSAMSEELELRLIERDISIQAAETASKQHLDSMKRVAKLEAECRTLKAALKKTSTNIDRMSVAASSVYVKSFTDSQSDCGERQLLIESDTPKITNECEPSRSESWTSAELDEYRSGKTSAKNLNSPSVEINLMDDFLEMERLAALPEGRLVNQPNDGDIYLKAQLDAMINRRSELEEMLEKMEMEKLKLEIALTERQGQLDAFRNRFENAEAKLLELEILLASTDKARKSAETELKSTSTFLEKFKVRMEKTERDLIELRSQLDSANLAREEVVKELEATSGKKEVVESRCMIVEAELKALLSRVTSLEDELLKERSLSGEMVEKYHLANLAREEAVKELQATSAKKEVAESRCMTLEAELKALLSRVTSLEDELLKERSLSGEMVAKCQKLEDEISRMQHVTEFSKVATPNSESIIKQDMELAERKFAECQKTIASLGRQLKYMATMDDFLIETTNSLEVS